MIDLVGWKFEKALTNARIWKVSQQGYHAISQHVFSKALWKKKNEVRSIISFQSDKSVKIHCYWLG